MSQRVFLSYAHEDQSLVEWEANTLIVGGLDVFLDIKSLRYGTEWPKKLIDKIRSANRFLLYWSNHGAQSEWVRNEYEEALRVRASRGNEQFLQIMKLDETPLPPPLDSIHYIDRSREELLIVASEAKRIAMLEGGLKDLLASGIIKIEKATPRTTKIIAAEAAALVANPPGEVRWSLKRQSTLPPSLMLSTFAWKERREMESRPLIIVPGMMGSELAVDGKVLWLNVLKLALGGMERLRIERARVQPHALVRQVYSSFLKQAELTTPVIACPYDWRLSFEDSAYSLADVIRDVFERDPACRPALVAHGTGCFVVRALAAFHPELWRKCRTREVSMVFVGAPENGSYLAAEMLTGSSQFLGTLSKVDLRHSKKEIETIFAAYPSLLQLLPQGPEQDLLDPAFWRGGQFDIDSAALASARKIRTVMASSIPSNEIRYIYGSGEETVAHISVEGSLVRKRASLRGDGLAPYNLTFPDSGPEHLYFANGPSSSVFGNPAVIRAVIDLASHGHTTVLSTQPPSEPR